MCGRFTLTAEPGLLARRFGAPPAHGGGAPRYNVAPTQTVVTVTDDGERHLEQMRWGLIPRWAKDPAIGSKLINARAETLAEKPAFKQALQRRRRLIPADGFYEWTTVPGSRKKQPLRVTLASGEPFAFAGLWDEWRPHGADGRDGAEGTPAVRTCTIVTTTPNELMARYHHLRPCTVARAVVTPLRDAYSKYTALAALPGSYGRVARLYARAVPHGVPWCSRERDVASGDTPGRCAPAAATCRA